MTPADPSLLAQLRGFSDWMRRSESDHRVRFANGDYVSDYGYANALKDARELLMVILEAHPPETAQAPLTFHAFSAANRARCESPSGFKHALSSWTASDWMTALVGEVGEAANIIKKLNRYRDGVPGNKESEVALRDKLRKELGDVFVYLDLLCQSQGFTIDGAAVEVFNQKSKEIGYGAELLAAPPCPNCGGDGWVLGGFDGEMGTPCSSCQPRPADTPPGLAPLLDAVCEHGTAMDVHCCNCHSGFLFDVQTCVCTFESPGPDFVELLNASKAHVRASVLWKRFIEHTPLENDIAVWMADFASDAQRQASASVRREAIDECIRFVRHRGVASLFALIHGLEALRDQPRVSPRPPSGVGQ